MVRAFDITGTRVLIATWNHTTAVEKFKSIILPLFRSTYTYTLTRKGHSAQLATTTNQRRMTNEMQENRIMKSSTGKSGITRSSVLRAIRPKLILATEIVLRLRTKTTNLKARQVPARALLKLEKPRVSTLPRWILLALLLRAA